MNVDLGIIWDRLTRMVIFLLFVAGLLGVGVWYYPLIKQNEAYRREIVRLDSNIKQEEEAGRQLRNSIDALRRDPKAIERLARESLSYGKPGETVIRFDPAPPPTNPPAR
jgi:cell division protein FtsB